MSTRRIETLDALIALTNTDLRDEPQRASDVVNRWFDEDPDRYAEGVLSAKLGMHHDQFAAYQHLTCERRITLHRRLAARCLSEARSGSSAGAFTIGRFVCTPHPVAFWNQLEDREIAFVLDEWVLHARYLRVLDEVGERRIRRARQLISERGLAEIRVTYGDALVFIPLKLSKSDLSRVAEVGGEGMDTQTRRLLDMLRGPYADFFDFEAPWSVDRLRRICEAEGIPMPRADDV